MTKEQEEAISTMQHWIDYEKRNKDKIQKADESELLQKVCIFFTEIFQICKSRFADDIFFLDDFF